jgi:CHRD domain
MLRRVVLATVFAAGVAFSASAATQQYHALLNGKSEVPPTSSKGTGTFAASLDTTSKVLTYTLTFEGLTGPATAAHIHGPAAKGANAGVVVPLGSGAPTSPVNGTATLTDEQIADLRAGKYYANVHTEANKAGEIRGTIVHGALPKGKRASGTTKQ